jgi:hypothetical protein
MLPRLGYFLVLGWLSACAATSGPGAGMPALEVSVVDDRGEALAEVPIHAHGRELGRSGPSGTTQLPRASLRPGGRLAAECPEAYRPAAPVVLPSDATLLPLPHRVQFVCRPRLRTLALVAYAPTARGSLVQADAQPLGRVGNDGTLHAVLRRPPGAVLTLSLETAPRQVRRITIGDRDEILLFDATQPE